MKKQKINATKLQNIRARVPKKDQQQPKKHKIAGQ
jgi:hypothetical protein